MRQNPTTRKKGNLSAMLVNVIAICIILFAYRFVSARSSNAVNAPLLVAASVAVSIFLLYLIVNVFGRVDHTTGLRCFFIGDEGTCSLSRMQAVLWAMIIIASQLAILLALLTHSVPGSFLYYEPVLSESALWLLSLSLTSYIAVKQISVNRLQRQPRRYKQKTASLSDILMGDNGLDFSRCQMLIWTLLAVVFFLNNSVEYVQHLQDASTISDIKSLLSNFYEEDNSGNLKEPPFVPYLPWSFVVLMGLSQGAYIGKKLIPTFKLDTAKSERQNELQKKTEELNEKQKLLQDILASSNVAPSPLDQLNRQQLQKEIDSIVGRIAELTREITQIEEFKTA